MEKAPPTHWPGLDTLRAFAILIVMRFHAVGYPWPGAAAAKYGWIGVDLFFVLSGFLIGAQLLRPYAQGDRPSFREFYLRRAFRILPAYLVVFGLYVLWPAFRERAGLAPTWQFLTFSENLFVDFAHAKAFSHVWSLCIEEQFYLLFPLLALLLTRRPSRVTTVATWVTLTLGGGRRGCLWRESRRGRDHGEARAGAVDCPPHAGALAVAGPERWRREAQHRKPSVVRPGLSRRRGAGDVRSHLPARRASGLERREAGLGRHSLLFFRQA